MSDESPENIHAPVLLHETIDLLNARRGGVFVDATLGLGGHTAAILEANKLNTVLAFDQDEEAIELARTRLKTHEDRLTIFHSNFAEIKSVLANASIEKVEGILADLGVSSLQLDRGERGFSFRIDAPLDMRMDPTSGDPTAAELLTELSETEIANIIYQLGEERLSRRIARRIVERREKGTPVTTTGELARLIERSVPRNPKHKIHPATRTFQALRIAVNRELEVLERFVTGAVDILKTEGRLAIITFHSLEDRIVKQAFQKLSGKCSCPPRIPRCVCGAKKEVKILTRKPITPSDAEKDENPRSRSAKLRVVEKIEDGSE